MGLLDEHQRDEARALQAQVQGLIASGVLQFPACILSDLDNDVPVFPVLLTDPAMHNLPAPMPRTKQTSFANQRFCSFSILAEPRAPGPNNLVL